MAGTALLLAFYSIMLWWRTQWQSSRNGLDVDEYVMRAYKFAYSDFIEQKGSLVGAITSAAVVVLDWNMGVCLLGFNLLRSRFMVLFVAGTSRVFLICFGIHYWYLGHCASYAIVASVLLGASVSNHLSILNPLAAGKMLLGHCNSVERRVPLEGQSSSSSSSEGCGSSVKRSSSSVEGWPTC
ncbi:hypothetical protein HPP92_024360 [Vanilla planifolia]|uniref:Uncharacterized protein n=1 Tax=Vanilla planifolia TaxID=51239 RepID=A0A835PS26_VANPL|nr:hypothetical protein HPP92_024360 [Vanilla planifolia]